MTRSQYIHGEYLDEITRHKEGTYRKQNVLGYIVDCATRWQSRESILLTHLDWVLTVLLSRVLVSCRINRRCGFELLFLKICIECRKGWTKPGYSTTLGPEEIFWWGEGSGGSKACGVDLKVDVLRFFSTWVCCTRSRAGTMKLILVDDRSRGGRDIYRYQQGMRLTRV